MAADVSIGLGGSCYWCTEAIFASLKGVVQVEQGWLSSYGEQHWPSEGIIMRFDPQQITLCDLIDIHLHTHSSTADHSRRHKYRSAVYTYNDAQQAAAQACLVQLQSQFDKPLITRAYRLNTFERSAAHYQDYYYTDPQRPFCQNIITPKLRQLLALYQDKVDETRLRLDT
ncbi:peptide-methionine (S)-S-oxide reductase [Vibrio parahaemolyticus]|jgi:peptide-methionine (S)-S-oxide reductase|uniref:peptide-methionine (S)-S-oxide reductase n=1 Tax=Alteromonas macleodii TaxID=28108 RepID=A0AB36FR97_ALTMA|nr:MULTISPECIES: peptide-methionine (S)-S-oxide reductase [Alteromonadales]EKO3632879.1 peptide-methionine (S)-S-oxide reductase [Vibrio metschnikovii]EKO3671116.1 peptide-methionine (S)-S-oxide reductase [Vibrio metschnikovii]EKO3729861.1 peptide-methionine (S)-S-oxide reductase [Vibrio metschnikovii]MCF2848319.1 peptide-methionine (S)-S-oxide reductase [Pseudoalteromonas sp. PAST1]MCG7639675.1 peptide-methionine (S)-S-oxide reductase [Alteromonas sp. CNT1-28]